MWAIRPYTALDIVASAIGYNVLYPIGWDAWPTMKLTIKHSTSSEVTERHCPIQATAQGLGFSFDWSRKSIQPIDYFKWTQWIFLKLFNMALPTNRTHQLVPSCKIGLANEEVVNGVCRLRC